MGDSEVEGDDWTLEDRSVEEVESDDWTLELQI